LAAAAAKEDESDVKAKAGRSSPGTTIWEPFHLGRKRIHQKRSALTAAEMGVEGPAPETASYRRLMNVRAPKTAWEMKVSLPSTFSISLVGTARANTMERRRDKMASTRASEAETVIVKESRISPRKSMRCVGKMSLESFTGILRVSSTQSKNLRSLEQARLDRAMIKKSSQYTMRLTPQRAQ
jgi:hypothetical protein